MKRFTQRKTKNSKLLAFLILTCLLGLILTTYLIIRSNFFTIKTVNVQAEKINCTDSQTIKNSSNLFGQNIIFINPSKVQELIKGKFICVKGVSVSRSFPDKVNLFASGRAALAKISLLKINEATSSSFLENIATPSGEQALDSFLVDDEGVIFSKEGPIDSPNIYFYDSSLSLGKKLDSTSKNSLEIIEKAKIFGLDVSKSLVSDNNLIIFSSPKIIFRLDSQVNVQLASLQLILEKAKIDDVRLQFVDLRFDKPIVKFAPKKNG